MSIWDEQPSIWGKSSIKKPRYPKLKPLTLNGFDSKKEKQLDSKRDFTNPQKHKAYDNQNGLCARCKNPVKTTIAEYHHIKFYAHGGASKSDNCQMLCPNCHREIHKEEMVKKADKKRKPKEKLSQFDKDRKRFGYF